MCLGLPGRVVGGVDGSQQTMLVDVRGRQQQVSAAMLLDESGEQPQPGDWALVHMGFALRRLDESEARDLVESLDALSGMYENALGTPGTSDI